MRIIILSLCALIIALTAHNLYLQENLKATITGEEYYVKIMQKYSKEIYESRADDK
jgi:uncharacterized protein YxeA